MKTKNKILKLALSSAGIITALSLPIYALSACGNNTSNTQQSVDAVSTSSEEDNRVKYTTVTFGIPEVPEDEPEITYTGDLVVKAKVGEPFGSIPHPAFSQYGHKFLHFSYSATQDNEVKSTDLIPDPAEETWTLYPVFQSSVTLSNCVGISTIEKTTITFTRSSGLDVNLYYTNDYGENWNAIFDNAAGATETSVTLEQLKPGENIFLRGDNSTGFSKASDQYVNISFSSGSAINLMGNIMGLLDKASGTIRTIPNDYCFYKLFRAESPETAAIQYISNTFLAVDKLEDHCYEEMFYGCANLINAPWLQTNWHNPETNADVVPTYCYKGLFYGCSRLETLRLSYNGDFTQEGTNFCFNDWLNGVPVKGEILFDGTVPEAESRSKDNIPAQWTVVNSWVDPEDPESDPSFTIECTDPLVEKTSTDPLTYATEVDHPYQFKANVGSGHSNRVTWFSSDSEYVDVNPETGIATPLRVTEDKDVYVFAYSKYSMEWWGSAKVTVDNLNLADCLKFESYEDDSTIAWEYVGDVGTTNLKYSTDGGANWIKFWPGPSSAVTLNANQIMYVKGNNPDGLNDPTKAEIEKENAYTHFLIGSKDSTKRGNVHVSGRLMGLLDDGRGKMTDIPSAYCFNHLFYEDNGLTAIEGDTLFDAATLTEGCYYSMFEWCEWLTTANDAPIGNEDDTILEPYCCTRMFYHCPELKTPVSMPATQLHEIERGGEKICHCCWRMFEFDAKLTKSPELFAETPGHSCYRMMFQECAALASPGKVHLTSLAPYCCYQMFIQTGFSVTSHLQQPTSYLFYCSSTGYTENAVYHMFPTQTTGQSGRWYTKN